jgi:hypothetical protein
MDDTCRCCNCFFYDDFEARCKLYPPAYAGRYVNEDEERVPYYSQPIIETAWAEWCGQWKPADENQTREQRAQQILSLIPKES